MEEERMSVEEKVQSLIEMGFGDEANVRKQLTRAKNDLSVAVAYLTDDDGSWAAPSSLSKITPAAADSALIPYDGENVTEFPETHLYDLIERAGGQNSWTIPYQKHESFGVLLHATTQFLERGQIDGIPSMDQFICQVLPDCIDKLTQSTAVSGWREDVVTGVYDMLVMTVELVAAYATHRALNSDLSNVLVNIFDRNNKYHNNTHVRHQKVNKIFVQQNMNNNWITPTPSSPFSLNLGASQRGEVSGWLIDFINHFAVKKGFEVLASYISPETDYATLAFCLAPFSVVSEILTQRFLTDLLSKKIMATYQQIFSCDDATLKSSQINFIFEILRYVQRLYQAIEPTKVEEIENCYFELLLRMVSLQNFGTRMNALKQVLNLFEAALRPSGKPVFTKEQIINWLNKSQFLNHAMSSNLDHAQYCDKIGKVLENMGSSLSKAHLKAVCDRLRNVSNEQATDNIANLLSQIIPKSGAEKMKEFLKFLQDSWATCDEWSRAKVLRLFDKVAASTRFGESEFYQSVVECVWTLAMTEASSKASNDLVAQIMDTHYQMIRDPGHNNRLLIWRQYAIQCFQNIKLGTLVYLSARQLLFIVKPPGSGAHSKELKTVLKELEDKGLSDVVIEAINNSVGRGGEKLLTTGAPDESQLVSVMLELIRQVYSNSDSYVALSSLGALWTSLVDRESVSSSARSHIFKWLRETSKDCKSDTRRHFFNNFMVRSIARLCAIPNDEMIECFREYFVSCNAAEGNIIENIDKSHYVQRPGLLVGMDCVWYGALTARDDFMASRWSALVVDFLVNKLQPVLLHETNIGAIRLAVVRKCISLILEWLPENLMSPTVRRNFELSEKVIGEMISEMSTPSASWLTQGQLSLAKVCGSNESSNFMTQNADTAQLQLRRGLEFIASFVASVDSRFPSARLKPAHQVSFVGAPVTIHCMPGSDDPNQSAFDIHTHSNELFGVIRSLIAKQLEASVVSVDARFSDSGKVITPDKDTNLLCSLGLGTSNVVIKVKKNSGGPFAKYPSISASNLTSSSSLSSTTPSPNDEKLLVGVGLSKISSFYQLLYLLLTENDRRIASTAMRLLQILPTDPAVSGVLTSLPSQLTSPSTVSHTISTPTSSLSSLSIGAASPSKHFYPSFFSESSLDSLLSAETQTPLLLLYNLQALSANLMPVSSAVAPVAITDGASTAPDLIMSPTENQMRFCSLFIQFNGLNKLAELLYHQKLVTSEDIVAKQESFRLVLRLMKHLLQYATVIEGSHACSDQMEVTPISCSPPVTNPPSAIHSALRNRPPISNAVASSPRTRTAITSMIRASSAGIEAIQNQQMFESLIRLCWATASGKLHSPLSITSVSQGSASFNSASTSSSSDRSSANTPTPAPTSSAPRRFTMPSEEHSLSTTDVELAKESLELCMLFLKTRGSLYSWFCNQTFVNEFLTAILVSCPSATIRQLSRREIFLFASTSNWGNTADTRSYPHPLVFLIDKLLKARVPFWSSSSIRRGPSQRLVSQCSDYFDLLADLIRNLSTKVHILVSSAPSPFDPLHQIHYEIDWLDSFTTSGDDPFLRLQRLDDLLLAGHINMLSAWVAFLTDSPKASALGLELIPRIFNSCLLLSKRFFSSFKSFEKSAISNSQTDIPMAKCSGHRARQATLDLLVALGGTSASNVKLISDLLTEAYSILPLEMVMDHFKNPVIPPKCPGGFVGLKNAGATCYMNAVIQQLFMIPKLSDALMSICVPSSSGADNRQLQLVFELQKIFAYLSKSSQQFYVPDGFWRNFGFSGVGGVNVREHQDAFDFFTTLVDTVDEALKKAGQQPVLGSFFRGVFLDEKVCEGCPHRFRTDNPFFSLSLPVASGSLEQSLQQYVKSERLEGENAYLCEKCQAKRNAVKRLSLKQLPPVLCFQLKRFYYDWERGVPQKFDTHFTFPWTLDVEPFTEEGFTRQDSSSSTSCPMETSSKLDCDASSSSTESGSSSTYQLVGIVVHSGQSNAGHYYSLIRDRRQDGVLNPNHGRWFNFNDTEVKEVPLDDSNIEHECFGGTYQVADGQSAVNYSGERVRSWSAYLLFYEHVEAPSAMARYAKRTRMSESVQTYHFPVSVVQPSLEPSMSCRVAAQRLDSLAELSHLLQQGERHGLFGSAVPAQLLQQITESNALSSWFLHLHDDAFTEFIQQLTETALKRFLFESDDLSEKAVNATTQMLTTFLFSILLPAFPSAISEKRLEEFRKTYDSFVNHSKLTALSGVSWLGHPSCLNLTQIYLLEHLEDTVRRIFREIVASTVSAYFSFNADTHPSLQWYFTWLLRILPNSPQQITSSTLISSPSGGVKFAISMSEHYFRLLFFYFTCGSSALTHALLDMEALNRLLTYLLALTGNGNNHRDSEKMNDVESESGIVALWQDTASLINPTSSQIYRQNGPACDYLHRCLATLLIGCDLSSAKTEQSWSSPVDQFADSISHGICVVPLHDHKPVPLDPAVRPLLPLYISELVTFSCEIDNGVAPFQLLESSFVHVCTGSAHLSTTAIQCLLTSFAKAPTSHLRPVVALLQALLRCPDSLHSMRVQVALDGFNGTSSIHGLLDLINQFRSVEGRRAYQVIKIICELSSYSEIAKQLLSERENIWSGAVDWLNDVLSGAAPTVSENTSNPVSPIMGPATRASTEAMTSNSPVSKSFLRTESACSTLKIARDLLRPASSDTSSTVTQLIDSPPVDDSPPVVASEFSAGNVTILEEPSPIDYSPAVSIGSPAHNPTGSSGN